jgi:hypothetical protein
MMTASIAKIDGTLREKMNRILLMRLAYAAFPDSAGAYWPQLIDQPRVYFKHIVGIRQVNLPRRSVMPRRSEKDSLGNPCAVIH